MRSFLATIACVCFFGVQMAAQHCHSALSGIVYDGDTGKGLPFATVHLPELNKGTVTDEHGHYTIADLCENQQYLVNVGHIGCTQHSSLIVLNEHKSYTFFIYHLADTLAPVVVQANQIKLHRSEIADQLAGQSLDAVSVRGLAQAIEQLPGVYSQSAGTSTSKPMIQGLTGNRLAVVQQGVVVEGQQWGSDHAPEVDPFGAESVEVIKGAAGVQYGVGAIGGAVVLKEPEWQEKTGGKLLTGFQMNGRTHWAAAKFDFIPRKTSAPVQWRFRVQPSGKIGGNVRTRDYYLDNTGIRERSLKLHTERSAERSTLAITASLFQQQFGILKAAHTGNLTDLYNALRAEKPIRNQDRFTYQIDKPHQAVTHWLTKGIYKYQINQIWTSESQLDWQYNIRREFDNHRNGSPNTQKKPALSLYNYTVNLQTALQHTPIRHWNGKFGVQSQWQYNQTGTGGYVPDQLTWATSLYALEHWRRYPDPLEYELGIRLDHRRTHITDTIGSLRSIDTLFQFRNLSATAGIIWTITEFISLRANTSFAWRPPNGIELYAQGVHHGAASYEQGNPTLIPEKAWSTGAQFLFQKPQLRLQISAYTNHVRDFIYLSPTDQTILTIRGAFPINRFEQAHALLTGADALVALHVWKGLGIASDGSLLRGWQTKARAWLPLMPPDRTRLALTIGEYYKNQSPLSGRLSYQFTARQSRIPQNAILAAPPGSFGLWSAELAYTRRLTRNKTLHIVLVSENLSNISYRNYLNSFRYFADEPGRMLSIQASLSF